MRVKIIRWLIVAIGMLLAYLVVTQVEAAIFKAIKGRGAHLATFIGMMLVILLFTPLFEFLDAFTTKFVKKLSSQSGQFFGRFGIFLFLFLMLLALYFTYLYIWFKKKPI